MFQGDVTDLDFKSQADLALLTSLKEQGILTVTVFLSGRGMWINPELNVADAFVVAWLPDSEAGQGWQQANIALSCFAKAGSNMQKVQVPFLLAADAGLIIQLREIKMVAAENIMRCTLWLNEHKPLNAWSRVIQCCCGSLLWLAFYHYYPYLAVN